MIAKINGIEVEGTPEEIQQLIKQSNNVKADFEAQDTWKNKEAYRPAKYKPKKGKRLHLDKSFKEWSPKEDEIILTLDQMGQDSRAIGKLVNRSTKAVTVRLYKLRDKRIETPFKRENYPYQCENCNRSFKSRSNLRMHRLSCLPNSLQEFQDSSCDINYWEELAKRAVEYLKKANKPLIMSHILEGLGVSKSGHIYTALQKEFQNFPEIQTIQVGERIFYGIKGTIVPPVLTSRPPSSTLPRRKTKSTYSLFLSQKIKENIAQGKNYLEACRLAQKEWREQRGNQNGTNV